VKTENPYKGLVNLQKRIAQGAALQPTVGIGMVVSPPPGIVIKYNGYELGPEHLWVDDYWIPGHTRHMVGSTSTAAGGSGEAKYESHKHPIDNDEALTDTWAAGDKVLLLPITGGDNRTVTQFVVLCKLKRLDGNELWPIHS
jgi:hypothetical protein